MDHIDCPLLILHGVDDELVPLSQGRKLFEAGQEPKRLVTIEAAGHMNVGDYPEFWAGLCGWMDDVVLAGKSPVTTQRV